MLKLPNLEKNAYLTIFIKGEDIYANLAYVDYTSGRSYILSDSTSLGGIDNVLLIDQFWVEYFQQISKKFNWEIFRGKEIMSVAAEGIGVSGVTVFYSNRYLKFDQIISKIRDISFDIAFVSVDSAFTLKALERVSQRLNYKDIVYVDLDIRNFSIFRAVLNNDKISLTLPKMDSYQTCVANMDWDQRASLVQNIHNSKLRAFLSLDIEERKLANTWANFVNKPIKTTNSNILKDIVRSYISVQLITMINENNGKLDNIGNLGETLVVLSGNLVKVLDIKRLAVSVLDGLELRGAVDLLVDAESKFLPFANEYSFGIESQNFVFSTNDIFKDIFKLVVGEIKDGKQQRKVIFTGKSEFSKKGINDVFALSPEINTFEIDNLKGFVSGKFVKGNYWGENYTDFEMFSDPDGVSYKGLIIDCRPKPIIYGPDARSNRNKLNAWINEIS